MEFIDNIFTFIKEYPEYFLSTVFYLTALLLFISTIIGSKHKTIRKNASITRIASMLCLFFSMFLALYITDNNYTSKWDKAYQAIIQFVLNTDFGEIITSVPNHFGKILAGLNMFTAPLITVTTIVFAFEELKNRFALFCYKTFYFNKKIYVFSELNGKSLSIAKSIARDKKICKKAKFVFADVFEQKNECSYELINELKDNGMIYTKDDINSLKFSFSFLNKDKNCSFFLIGEDEEENLSQLCNLIDYYGNHKDNVEFYLFSKSSLSELTVCEKLKKYKEIPVKRIDYKQSMIYNYLYNFGEELTKGNMNISILGLGEYGMEMLKALLWFCRNDNKAPQISVYDKNANIEEKFRSACPGFYDEETIKAFNNIMTRPVFNKGFSENINFENNSHLEEIFKNNHNADFIFVSTGDDDRNIRIAQKLRELYVKKDIAKTFQKNTPAIVAVVHNATLHNTLSANKKNSTYNITTIGSFEEIYCKDILQINTELEEKAYATHSDSYGLVKFYKEYNYKSSISQVIYHNSWSCKEIENLEDTYNTNSKKLQENEKNRWNYYLLSQGYCYRTDNCNYSESEEEDLKWHYHCHRDLHAFTDEENRNEWKYTYKALWAIKNYKTVIKQTHIKAGE